jgi:hypothetical protein
MLSDMKASAFVGTPQGQGKGTAVQDVKMSDGMRYHLSRSRIKINVHFCDFSIFLAGIKYCVRANSMYLTRQLTDRGRAEAIRDWQESGTCGRAMEEGE